MTAGKTGQRFKPTNNNGGLNIARYFNGITIQNELQSYEWILGNKNVKWKM